MYYKLEDEENASKFLREMEEAGHIEFAASLRTKSDKHDLEEENVRMLEVFTYMQDN